ncbi:delta-sarcoglycan-like [Liolophura sinensis]|uniref:delta-sarcoglycan-like n=1 Tax=Liolophura sinensis TaxID=3198878 RepID=UPI003158D424
MTSTLTPGDADNPTLRKHRVGIYGWRKRCLYGFILVIFAILIINIALTVWIIRVMDFSIRGMGRLQIIEKGVRVNGEVEFLDSLYTSSVKTRNGENLYVESSGDVVIHARDHLDRIANEINISNGEVKSVCENFVIKDKNGKLRFGVNKNGVTLGQENLNVEGLSVDKIVQSPIIRGPSRESLRVVSVTRDVRVTGPAGVELRAPAGKIHLNSLNDILITSKGQGIRFDAEKMYLKNLPLGNPPIAGDPPVEVYQLCACKDSGRLFLDKVDGPCTNTASICS